MNYKITIQQLYKYLFLGGLLHLTFSVLLEPNTLTISNWFIGLVLTTLYFISHE